MLRLLDVAEANPPAYSLLCRYLDLLDRRAAEAAAGAGAGPDGHALGLAFRLKLALAAGFSPELGSCARCGEREGIVSFSGAAGGVVCGSCEAGGFPVSADAHRFMVAAIGAPIAQLPAASEAELRQVDRAIGDTLAHHAHVNLRAVA